MKVQEIIRNDGFSPFVGEVLHIAHNQTMPYVVTDAQKLTVEVAAGVRTHVVLLHTVAHEATVNIALAEGATLAVSEIFIAEAFVDMTLTQASQSTCTLFVAELTSANVSYRFALDGDHAECTMNGLFLVADAEHCVTTVRVEHNAPDCHSYSLVKGVAGGAATGEFRGLVYVAPDAQRTDAQQQSRNILLSEQARIQTKPQLEIYADDVKCTHGATVGQMDTEALLYMRQRGLSELQARALQIEGFVSEVVSHCEIEPLRKALMAVVADKLHKI